MNRITYSNSWAVFKGPDIDEAWSLLSYRKPGYFHSQAYKSGHWDGWMRMLNYKSGQFPAGLTSYIRQEFAKRQLPIEVVDARPPELGRIPMTHDLQLQPHQLEAIEVAIEKERGIVQHPTAAGKTWTEVGLAAALQQKTIVFIHRKDILAQLFKFFHEHIKGATVGIIGDGKWEPGDITVATFQSVWSKLGRGDPRGLQLLAETGCFIIDEGHHIPADTFSAVLRLATGARYRYAFSATAFKSGDEHTFFRVQGWAGPMIHEVSPEEGVEAGRLVPATVFFIKPTWREPDVTDLNWREEYREGIVYNEGRNRAILSLAQKFRHAGPVLILVDRLRHGEELSRRLACPFLRGDTKLKARSEGWAQLKDGTLDCVVASRIADEGVDIPGIQFLILAGGGKSAHLVIQRIGRGMRASEGKKRLYVFDFADKGKRLHKHENERLFLYKNRPSYMLEHTTLEELLS